MPTPGRTTMYCWGWEPHAKDPTIVHVFIGMVGKPDGGCDDYMISKRLSAEQAASNNFDSAADDVINWLQDCALDGKLNDTLDKIASGESIIINT